MGYYGCNICWQLTPVTSHVVVIVKSYSAGLFFMTELKLDLIFFDGRYFSIFITTNIVITHLENYPQHIFCKNRYKTLGRVGCL